MGIYSLYRVAPVNAATKPACRDGHRRQGDGQKKGSRKKKPQPFAGILEKAVIDLYA